MLMGSTPSSGVTWYGLFEREGKWRTRFEKRSPRYTTRWDEILQV